MSPNPPRPRARRLLRWFAASAAVLVIALVLVIMLPGWLYDTDALPEGHGGVNTEIFLGAGDAQPLLVGFGGSEGGNAWASERWKAQRQRFVDQGFAFLAVGYFGAPGTPQHLDRISLDAVHAAIKRAATDPRIDGRCIVLMGGSKGAELALALAANYPDVRGVVGLVPGNAVFAGLTPALTTSSLSLRGKPLPFVPVPWSATPGLLSGDHRAAFDAMLRDTAAVDKAAIPVERINGPILLLSATRDEMWDSTRMSEAMMSRLAAADFSYPHRHVAVKGDHAAPLDHFATVEEFIRGPVLSACRAGTVGQGGVERPL